MIKCERFIVFRNNVKSIIAVYIKCNLFTRIFYLDKEVEWVAGPVYDNELNKRKVEMKLFNDDTKYEFLMDAVEWEEVKTYKDQINEFLKG